METTYDAKSLPVEVVDRLVKISRYLPKIAQGSFLRGCVTRISELSLKCENTIFFGAVGAALGEMIDHLLTVNIPAVGTVELSGDCASLVGLVIGSLHGIKRDIQSTDPEGQMLRITTVRFKTMINTAV